MWGKEKAQTANNHSQYGHESSTWFSHTKVDAILWHIRNDVSSTETDENSKSIRIIPGAWHKPSHLHSVWSATINIDGVRASIQTLLAKEERGKKGTWKFRLGIRNDQRWQDTEKTCKNLSDALGKKGCKALPSRETPRGRVPGNKERQSKMCRFLLQSG